MASAPVKRNDEHIPTIEFPYPPCPVCDETLSLDDSWYCDSCHLTWDSNGMAGSYSNGHRSACGDERDLELYPTKRVVCHLDEGHDGDQAGYDRAEADKYKYAGPPEWYRWNKDGEHEW